MAGAAGEDSPGNSTGPRSRPWAFFDPEFCASNSLLPILEAALDAALGLTLAKKGCLQLMEPDGALRMAAQRGFNKTFLDFFESVQGDDPHCACGLAVVEERRVVVEDVSTSVLFTPHSAGVLLENEARAVQATPLLSRSKRVLGVLSTHYLSPVRPSDAELVVLDGIAGRAASWIEWKLADLRAR
jgi:GAF domain-containing protein